MRSANYATAEALHKRLSTLGRTRRELDEAREQLLRDAGDALLEVGDVPQLSMATAAGLLQISRQAAYDLLEAARRRKGKA